MARFTAVIPAAGQGKRMQGDRNKQFLLLEEVPVIVHTLRVFQTAPVINEIIVVCAEGEEDYYRAELIPRFGVTKCNLVITGGAQRQDSVFRGLEAISSKDGYVMVHDGARPFVTEELINALAREVIINNAVVPGVLVKDTIKRTDSAGFITDTPPRDGLWHIQTPQTFEVGLLKDAYAEAQKAGFYGTDDASLVEHKGIPVKVIPGSYENIKITTPEDMTLAGAILRRRLNP